ncbi:MAG: sulfurtransferase [Chloroflexota bacterium]|nr:sulfurtransferase [Chloroflexota bacterium]
MNRHHPHRSTRRAVLGTGLALGLGGGRAVHAQATPGASPVADTGYARPEMLVDAIWLCDQLDDPSVLAVGLMPAGTFADGAIPGSMQIDWPDLEVTDTSDDSLAAWQATVEDHLTRLGLTRDRTVVAYDEGTLFAARLWWVLHYLGHERVHVLNGGLPAWIEAGYEVATGQPALVAADEPYVGAAQPDALAQVPEVEAAIGDADTVIVDARTPDEYAAGHVPGAVNINYPLNAEPDAPKFWKPAGDLKRLYGEAGVTPDRWVIPYCSTGVRSAVTSFTLWLIGYDDVSLFTGSWAEWTLDPERPVTTGDAP